VRVGVVLGRRRKGIWKAAWGGVEARAVIGSGGGA